LIRAYAKLRQETAVDVPLIIVGGKGWIYDDIFTTIDELGLREHVRHLSGVFDEQLAHLYYSAGVLVTPSHYEGFGLPALEAMNCGCPAIVSRRGSLPEIVGPKGVMIDDPDDIDTLAGAIEMALLDSEHRAKMIKIGYEHAKTFSWQKAAQLTLDIYKKANR
ncbi:MAG: glycosyltransferase family 1 protein, partial [Chloroflexota bacterium]